MEWARSSDVLVMVYMVGDFPGYRGMSKYSNVYIVAFSS